MKNQLFILHCFLFSTLYLNAQTNTFPSSGSVGIGTTTPDPESRLHIESPNGIADFTLLVKSVGINNWSGFYKDASNNFDLSGSNGSGVVKFRFDTAGSSFINSGFFGIGTTTPNYFLDIKSDSGTSRQLHLGNEDGVMSIGGNNLGQFLINGGRNKNGNYSTTHGVGIHGLNGVTTGTAFNPRVRMRITSNGNVGIGTSTPNANLHVKNTNGKGVLIVQGKQDATNGNSASIVLSTEHSTANILSGSQTGRKTIIKSVAGSNWGKTQD